MTPCRQISITARRLGFTLVELVAVLILTALLAAAVSVSLKGVRRDVALDDSAARLRAYDGATRDAARLAGRPLVLRFDLSAAVVSRLDPESQQARGTALPLRAGASPRDRESVTIDRMMTPDGEAAAGEVDVLCSARGWTPSYAVLLAGPNGRREWVLFAGLTGEARTIRDDRQVRETLALLRPGVGDDAD